MSDRKDTQTYKAQNGWTKEKMKAQIRLKNNGKMSTSSNGGCAYRGENENACAAGCFIPDKLVTPSIEGMSINDEGIWNQVAEFMPLNIFGMRSMQIEHDCVGEDQSFGQAPIDVRDHLCQWVDEHVEDS